MVEVYEERGRDEANRLSETYLASDECITTDVPPVGRLVLASRAFIGDNGVKVILGYIRPGETRPSMFGLGELTPVQMPRTSLPST